MGKPRFVNATEAVTDLCRQDHGIMSPEYAREAYAACGVDPKRAPVYRCEDTRSQFKGATLAGRKEGESEMAADADGIAAGLCNALDLEYRPMFGRGSGLRECCRALREHFAKADCRA